MPSNPLSRDDAWAKASGALRYVGDQTRPGMLHAAVVRSLVPRARILGVDTKVAESAPGVIGVFTAADVIRATYGRALGLRLVAGESIFTPGVYTATASDPRISCSQLQKESRVRLSVRKTA